MDIRHSQRARVPFPQRREISKRRAGMDMVKEQLVDPIEGAAPCEAAVEVCCPWAACLASFGRQKRQGKEARTVQTAGIVMRRGLCNLIFWGNRQKIETLAKQFRVDRSHVHITDPRQSSKIEKYTRIFHESCKHKGVTLEQARNILLENVNYFGTCMISAGGCELRTEDAEDRTILRILVVSTVFFLCLPGRVLVYGDCAINSNSTSEELAAIAVASIDTAAAFGIMPRVAMLSYATGDSNKGPLIQKIIDATAIVRKQHPESLIEGPLQADSDGIASSIGVVGFRL